MKTIVRWRWRVHQEFTGKPYTTRHHMSEADALGTDPLAVRIDWTREEITVPESDAEFQYTSAFQRYRPCTD